MKHVQPLESKTPEQEEMELYERAVRAYGRYGCMMEVKSACIQAAAAIDEQSSEWEKRPGKRLRQVIARTYVALNMLTVAIDDAAEDEIEALEGLKSRVEAWEQYQRDRQAREEQK